MVFYGSSRRSGGEEMKMLWQPFRFSICYKEKKKHIYFQLNSLETNIYGFPLEGGIF
jgi:hypothetical protein